MFNFSENQNTSNIVTKNAVISPPKVSPSTRKILENYVAPPIEIFFKCLIGGIQNIVSVTNSPVNVISKKSFFEILGEGPGSGNFYTADDIKVTIEGNEYHGFISTLIEIADSECHIRENFFYRNDQAEMFAVLNVKTAKRLGLPYKI
jgi:hypothetical protein